MNFVGPIAFALLMLSACSPRYDRMTSDQLSELLTHCKDPRSSPFSDPVIAELLGNEEVSDDPQFDAAAAREFAQSVHAKWKESLDEAELCLSKSAPADRTCEAFLACQEKFVEEEL
jgi:hypothetical protein